MLEPQDRRQLLEALRPPPGYELDCAIGTTFTLDLVALLITPVAFTMFDMEERDGELLPDPLAWMEALRRYSTRISLFCQAGQIGVPRHDQLLSFVESAVIEVAVPHGLFHPKVWALRFTSGDEPVIYRLLCLSRNLTFDRSWDTMLVLEGELIERRHSFQGSGPLGDFFAALPGLALREVPEHTRAHVDLIQDELRRVRFEVPASFERVAFWPLGISTGRRWPFSRDITRAMVVSPFIGASFLNKLAGGARENVLVSRPESIDALGEQGTGCFDSVYVLSQSAEPEEMDSITADESRADVEAEVSVDPAPAMRSLLAGLHAKLFVIESGRDVSIFTGSANATTAAFNSNVEFLVELVGERRTHGISAMLKHVDGETRLIDLLQSYDPPAEPVEPELEEELELRLDAARITIARGGLTGRITTVEGEEETFTVELALAGDASITIPDGMVARCRPITLQAATSRPLPLDSSTAALFTPVSFVALTTFVTIDLSVTAEGCERRCSFVMNIPFSGMPENRQQRLLISMLSDKARVLRFLLLLLADGRFDPAAFLGNGAGDKTGKPVVFGAGMSSALFESLVKAFDREPAKLDQIARVIDDLCKTEAGVALLPDGFMEIWAPVWQARQESMGRSDSSIVANESADTPDVIVETLDPVPESVGSDPSVEDALIAEPVPAAEPTPVATSTPSILD